MIDRIRGAWGVLRGTHKAQEKVDAPAVPGLYIYSSGTPTATAATHSNVWIRPRTGSVDR